MQRNQTVKALPEKSCYTTIETPLGEYSIVVSDEGVHAVFPTDTTKMPQDCQHNPNHKIIVQTVQQLQEYFAGKRKDFDLPLAANGTPFQQQAWQQLSNIPYGETISYSEQAKRMGDKNKSRAIGLANGRNPISIIIPCHRVIGANGKLTGYAGGLDRKAFLLEFEKRTR